MKSYNYALRDGRVDISWKRFDELSKKLAEFLFEKKIDTILGIARAGLFPATAVSCALRRELYPVRVTRRVDDIVRYESPIWRVDVPSTVAGQRIAVIDEIADSGETLALVSARALERGAGQVWTLSLVAHSWANPQPDFSPMISDGLIIFPWDKQVLTDKGWHLHPELENALGIKKQDLLDEK